MLLAMIAAPAALVVDPTARACPTSATRSTSRRSGPSTIPDDRNAFVLYRQAAERVKPLSDFEKRTGSQVDHLARWSKTTPEVRRWAEANCEAMAIYRQGAEMPNALDSEIGSHQPAGKAFQTLRPFYFLALLEGSRLEEQGDMAGAWGCYRAMLRAVHHIGMHGTTFKRLISQRWHSELRDRVTTWAADPRTTTALIRQAISDVSAFESLAPSEIDTLKLEYLELERMLDDPKGPGAQMPAIWLRSVASWKSMQVLLSILTPEQRRSISRWWRFWRREPERSRRVIRLLIANWLAYYDLPPEDRPKPDLRLVFLRDGFSSSSTTIHIYALDVPAWTRALSPEAVGRWLKSTHDAQILLRMIDLRTVQGRVWANQRDLLILLGTQLYRRDHGTNPPTPEALVGPYLKSLPAEFPDDVRDEAIPRKKAGGVRGCPESRFRRVGGAELGSAQPTI